MEGLITIITPNYNSSKYLLDTFKSVQSQSYQDWEWIIVDDNSSDDSKKIIHSFNDPRIRLLENSENKGAAYSRNLALAKARGRFITFLDSDDLWEESFLEISINYLIKSGETLVYSSYKRVDENLKPLLDDFIAIDYIDYKRILFNCPIPMLTAMYDTKMIGKIYFPEVELREDHAMWINLLKKIKYARAIQQPLGIYRMRGNSVSRNKFMIGIKQFELYRKFMNMNFLKSSYYTLCWAINGLKKYGKL